MQEVTFEITGLCSEKNINGKTKISARCIQDSILLNIDVFNVFLHDNGSVKRRLLEEHDRLLKLAEILNTDIVVGTIL